MLVEERRQKLSDVVLQRGFVPLPELVATMGVSESTVRRDLDYLHEAGVLRRTHGGAVAVGERAALPAFDDRTGRQIREKRAIGKRMAEIIQDGETILLDGGTTTYEVARNLVGRSLQVVTNSLPIANLLGVSRHIDLVLIGGYVYPKTGVALGPIAQRTIRDLHPQRLVMSVGGLTERGLFNSNLLLVETERAMIECADETNVVADHSKFGLPALAFLTDWSCVHRIVVDDAVRPEQLALVGRNVVVEAASRQNGAPQEQEKS
jgi:DeoR/GlpR family transcriptional regulator of sugar metabolism